MALRSGPTAQAISPLRIAIYSFSSNGYDFEVSPVVRSRPGMEISLYWYSRSGRGGASGWQRRAIDSRLVKMDPKLANRRLKFVVPSELRGYDVTIYVDANTILKQEFVESIAELYRSGSQFDLALYHHEVRSTVKAELEECLARGMLSLEQFNEVVSAIDTYSEGRWSDTLRPLYRGTILVRRTPSARLDVAMEELWALFQASPYRDQFFLPPVAERRGLSVVDLTAFCPQDVARVYLRHRTGNLFSDLNEYRKIRLKLSKLRRDQEPRPCAG